MIKNGSRFERNHVTLGDIVDHSESSGARYSLDDSVCPGISLACIDSIPVHTRVTWKQV